MGQQLLRKALHELVWSEPRTVLARRLGISDSGLAKACRKAGIPMPARGYWARLAAGKLVEKVDLPLRALGQSDSVQIGNPDPDPLSAGAIATVPPEPVFEESVEGVRARADALLLRCRVPKGLQNPHRLVAALIEEDLARRRALDADRFAIYRPRFETKPALRRLRLVNALFMAMAHAGCQPSVSSKDLDRIGCRVGDTFIEVKIGAARTKGQAGRRARTASDEALELRATGWPCPPGVTSVWTDTDSEPLEGRVVEIVRDLLVMGELVCRAAAREQYEWQLERLRRLEADARAALDRQEREEQERRCQVEAARHDWLLKQATNRRRAHDIRALVHATDARFADPSDEASRCAYMSWRLWALAQADLLDPCLGPLAALVNPPGDPERSNGSSA